MPQINQITPFQTVEQRKLAVSNAGGTGSASVTFTNKQDDSFLVSNIGTKGAQCKLGTTSATAVVSGGGAGADGTDQFYLPAGAIRVVYKTPGVDTVAAICDSTDTTTLIIEAGRGS